MYPNSRLRDAALDLARQGRSARDIRLEMQRLAADAADYAIAWMERQEREERRREISDDWAEDLARNGVEG